LKSLHIFYLDRNNLSFKRDNNLFEMEKIQSFLLSYNRIESARDLNLNGLTYIDTLNLNHNQIKHIRNGDFDMVNGTTYPTRFELQHDFANRREELRATSKLEISHFAS